MVSKCHSPCASARRVMPWRVTASNISGNSVMASNRKTRSTPTAPLLPIHFPIDADQTCLGIDRVDKRFDQWHQQAGSLRAGHLEQVLRPVVAQAGHPAQFDAGAIDDSRTDQV